MTVFRLNALAGKFLLGGGSGNFIECSIFGAPSAFSAELCKDTDAYFTTTQPLEYLPLNLVVREDAFFRSNVLGKQPYPYLYSNYVGWVAVGFAVGRLFRPPSGEKRKLYFFFLLALILVFLAASAISLKVIFSLAPGILKAVFATRR
ncbi:MAG: hypothetical protein KatS3mg045_0772 [Bellilinea sp.]|nr:MAG: hypothetical protein KatS3mg045_0772 [Bellilinea sp.]